MIQCGRKRKRKRLKKIKKIGDILTEENKYSLGDWMLSMLCYLSGLMGGKGRVKNPCMCIYTEYSIRKDRRSPEETCVEKKNVFPRQTGNVESQGQLQKPTNTGSKALPRLPIMLLSRRHSRRWDSSQQSPGELKGWGRKDTAVGSRYHHLFLLLSWLIEKFLMICIQYSCRNSTPAYKYKLNILMKGQQKICDLNVFSCHFLGLNYIF